MKYWLYLFFLICNIVKSADYYWVGTTNSWTTNTNWRLGSTGGTTPSAGFVIGTADNVFITSGTVAPKLPTTTLTILGLTISASKSLDLNGSAGFNLTGSVNLQSGSIVNTSTTVTTIVGINNTDLTLGTSTGNLGFTIGAVAPNDKITLNITTAKFRNYGSLNCYANLNLIYKVNTTTPSDNFINELGTNNFRGTFTLTINENTVATKFGESAGTDTFWKTAIINKYSNVDFSIGTINDSYNAVFEGKLTLNGEAKVGTNTSNFIFGDQCNATFTLKAGLAIVFTKNNNIILGKYSASKQPNINITGGNVDVSVITATYTGGNLELYKVNSNNAGTSVNANLLAIGSIVIDKSSNFAGYTQLTANAITINAATFMGNTSTSSTANLRIANTAAVTFGGDVGIVAPQFTTATLLGAVSPTAIPINFKGNLTITQSPAITTYANSNVNGFKYAVFNGTAGNQIYTSNSLVPFYRLDVNRPSGYLQLNSPLFMNYSVDNTTDVINLNLTSGKIVGSETNRLIIYRSRYAINGYTNNNYIAAGLVVMSNDATNLPLKKFLPVGAATNYAPIEITSNTSASKLLSITYFNQNPQTLNSNFTGGALDVSNCEYWKIVELDANLAALTVANLFDLDKVSLPYVIPKCTKITTSNHAVGYSFKNGSVYTPWEKLGTAFNTNTNAATTSYISGTIEPTDKLLKQQAEILVSFSYENVLILNTTDVFSNPCVITTIVDGVTNFTSGPTGTGNGIIKLHPIVGEAIPLDMTSVASESQALKLNIGIGTDGKPLYVFDYATSASINPENFSINNYTLAFKNSPNLPAFEQYTTNLSSDGITLPTGVTTFTVTLASGITPTKLEVFNGATGTTLLGSTTSTVSPISYAGITVAGSYKFVLTAKDQNNQTVSVTGFFIK